MPKRTINLAIAAIWLLVGACGSDQKLPTETSPVVGTYNLVNINNFPVPVTVSLSAIKQVEITASVLVLESSRTFSNTTTYRTTESGTVTSKAEKCSGTFFFLGASIVFTEPTVQNTTCGSRYTGIWDNANQIIVDFDPTTHAVFLR